MTSKFEEDWETPKRDNLGRFQKGSTGNPHGRPPKQPEEPWSLGTAFAKEFQAEVSVADGGTTKSMMMREAFVASIVRRLTKATVREQLMAIEKLQAIGAFNPLQPSYDEENWTFTEEDRRVLEIAQKALEASSRCSSCRGELDDVSVTEERHAR